MPSSPHPPLCLYDFRHLFSYALFHSRGFRDLFFFWNCRSSSSNRSRSINLPPRPSLPPLTTPSLCTNHFFFLHNRKRRRTLPRSPHSPAHPAPLLVIIVINKIEPFRREDLNANGRGLADLNGVAVGKREGGGGRDLAVVDEGAVGGVEVGHSPTVGVVEEPEYEVLWEAPGEVIALDDEADTGDGAGLALYGLALPRALLHGQSECG
ncbi:unnamed protein product, partial [Musa acuminata subsp. burmannicoides]